ncbi:hypothetical protein DRP04_12100, partial [Archaeoglobales archaeon]
ERIRLNGGLVRELKIRIERISRNQMLKQKKFIRAFHSFMGRAFQTKPVKPLLRENASERPKRIYLGD